MNEFELDLNVVRDLVLEIDTNIYHGADGATFTPSVSSAGVISWTNDKSLPNPDSVNIKGPAGVGVPSGGTSGQILKKHSATDYDTEWSEDSGLPSVSSPTDDGKVLRVVSGVWAAVELPSASGVSF